MPNQFPSLLCSKEYLYDHMQGSETLTDVCLGKFRESNATIIPPCFLQALIMDILCSCTFPFFDHEGKAERITETLTLTPQSY